MNLVKDLGLVKCSRENKWCCSESRRHRFHQLTALVLPVVVWNIHRSRANSCSVDTCAMNEWIQSVIMGWIGIQSGLIFVLLKFSKKKSNCFFKALFFSVLRMFFCIVTLVKWKKTLQFWCFRNYVTTKTHLLIRFHTSARQQILKHYLNWKNLFFQQNSIAL